MCNVSMCVLGGNYGPGLESGMGPFVGYFQMQFIETFLSVSLTVPTMCVHASHVWQVNTQSPVVKMLRSHFEIIFSKVQIY